MNAEKLSKNLIYEGLDQFQENLYKHLSTIYKVQSCKIVKSLPRYNFNKNIDDIDKKSILKISLEMKIPSFKELKAFTSGKFNTSIINTNDFRLGVVGYPQQDTPCYFVYSSEEQVIKEIKKYFNTQLKETK